MHPTVSIFPSFRVGLLNKYVSLQFTPEAYFSTVLFLSFMTIEIRDNPTTDMWEEVGVGGGPDQRDEYYCLCY